MSSVSLYIAELRASARVYLRFAERDRATLARAPGTTAPVIERAAAYLYGRHRGLALALLEEAHDLEAGTREPDWSAIEAALAEAERERDRDAWDRYIARVRRSARELSEGDSEAAR